MFQVWGSLSYETIKLFIRRSFSLIYFYIYFVFWGVECVIYLDIYNNFFLLLSMENGIFFFLATLWELNLSDWWEWGWSLELEILSGVCFSSGMFVTLFKLIRTRIPVRAAVNQTHDTLFHWSVRSCIVSLMRWSWGTSEGWVSCVFLLTCPRYNPVQDMPTERQYNNYYICSFMTSG